MNFSKEIRKSLFLITSSSLDLASHFGIFYRDKNVQIHIHLSSLFLGIPPMNLDGDPPCKFSFKEFDMVSSETLMKCCIAPPTKSSSLDPIPAWLLKDCAEVITPFHTIPVNKSLQTGFVPDLLEEAVITPLIGKNNMERTLVNYRPVSHLGFVSKLIERMAAIHLKNFLSKNNML
ncbi:putative RNA-directed DNA polymerase from mobile element jockey-like [Apostichopus japonicus]|uniref:Putative RNA-directed DNA polymerase from mobile element jockey-like n=1 Tax=Stichopus japonicus TaxID=307972 RepID=A0A2G8KDX9_STIJA|nr:putative RNA-directed DNA polymerase from mobile element jockey-like [Apostichopus japonicus]